MVTRIGIVAGTTGAVMFTTSLTLVTAAIWAIEPAIRMESVRLATTRTRISRSIRILAVSMMIAITVTAGNLAIRVATRRNIPMAIEPATSPLSAGTKIVFFGEAKESGGAD